ncbi:hypothetical protein, partial [Streptococcus pneumoniae]|uniref:hypothetical protein n=1 Tax=Streptococcus pneumoniae TaxID=1313 RepID=UPI001952AE97
MPAGLASLVLQAQVSVNYRCRRLAPPGEEWASPLRFVSQAAKLPLRRAIDGNKPMVGKSHFAVRRLNKELPCTSHWLRST